MTTDRDDRPRPARIWLLHGADPDGGDLWCDEPNPTDCPEMQSTEYIRADLVERAR